MTTTTVFDTTITGNIAMTDWFGGGGSGEVLKDFVLDMKTHTAGLGNLLFTFQYYDGHATQQLNVSMLLTAGNYIQQQWPLVWEDLTQPMSVQWTYLGGIVSGSADVKLKLRE